MQVDYNQFLGLVYADLFDFPLSKREVFKWRVSKDTIPRKTVCSNGKYLFLKGRDKLVKLRLDRERNSERKMKVALKSVEELKDIDSILAIFVTGSVATLNAKDNSDIDLMIVTKPWSLWKTRLRVVKKLQQLGVLRHKYNIRDKICINIFLDSQHLEILNKNLYTAHEILQAKCIFDRGGIESMWLLKNSWVKDFLPGINRSTFLKFREELGGARVKISILEIIAFLAQYIYMRPKMTSEKIGLGYAFFHPVNGSKLFLDRFEEKLRRVA